MDNVIRELLDWLDGEKYCDIDENSTTMKEEYEKKYKYELATNIAMNKVIKKIESLNTDNFIHITSFEEMEKDRTRFYNLYHELFKEHRDYKIKANERVERLLDEHKFLMTLCMRYENENIKLKRKLDSYE